MADTKLAPLSTNVPIVDPKTGNPTPYFQNLLQILFKEKGLDEDNLATDIENLEDLADVVSNLSLDDLTDVNVTTTAQGDILYRNGTEWVRLPAGTSGQFLKTLGAGANPLWALPTGGGAWNMVDATGAAVGSSAAIQTTAGQTSHAWTNLGSYSEFIVMVRNLAQSVSGSAIVHVSTNNGSSYYTTSGDYTFIPVTSGIEANTTGLGLWVTGSTAVRAGVVHIFNPPLGRKVALCYNDPTNTVRTFGADQNNPINAIRVTPNGGTWSAGGFLYLFAR